VAAAPAKRSSDVVVPQQADLGGRVLARLIWFLANLLAATLRFRWEDNSGAFEKEPDRPVIFCIWHNRLALSLILYRRHVQSRWRHRRMAGMVSASRDGGMLARVLELFRVRPVRGSSSRRGAQALKEAATAIREGCDLAITPDGPRGPCYQLQPGIVSVAQFTGSRVIPVAYRLSQKVTLKSWDRFQIPLPFARVDVTLAPAVDIPRRLNEAELETHRARLEQTMRDITRDD
jgi:lysophospholipid acyltransferase (LPLAT)-like uncharacterized protein